MEIGSIDIETMLQDSKWSNDAYKEQHDISIHVNYPMHLYREQ